MTDVVVRFLKYINLSRLITLNQTRENATKKDIITCINLFYSFVTMHAKNDHNLEKILTEFLDIKPR